VPDGETASNAEAAFLEALRELDAALDLNIERARRMKKRIAALERVHARGRLFREIVPEEQTPLIVHLLSESQQTLQAVAARLRRSEVGALYGEGMTMEQIARLFGVTRQRVSALLRDETGD
jgi:predicted transcriptional regulator